jgi:hypothetical protein
VPKKGSYNTVLNEHRKRLVRLSERRGVDRIKSLYDKAQSELESKIGRALGRPSQPFTAGVHKLMRAQVRQGQVEIASRMAEELGDVTKDTQVDALRSAAEDIAEIEDSFTGAEITLPTDEASRFWGVIDEGRSSLLKMHAKSMATYGAGMVAKMEEGLALSLATGETLGQAISRVQDTAEVSWVKGEQIVRTETAWAYNATHADAFEEFAEEMNDLMMRWTEFVDDDDFEPLDMRVGQDSIEMHGQLVKPGGVFRMPSDADVHESLLDGAWFHPPNRPNDRAVLAPWRPHWGVPGYTLRGGIKSWR